MTKQRKPAFLARRHRREQRRGGSYYDPLLDLLVTSSRPGDTAILHEWIHFLDHVATSYGCLIDQLVEASARGWGQLLEASRETGVRIPVPLDAVLRDGLPEGPIGGSEQDRTVMTERFSVTAVTYDLLMGLLDAMEGRRVIMDTDSPAVAGLAVIERMFEGAGALPASTQELAGLPVWQRPEQLYPEVAWGLDASTKGSVGIGMLSLVEGRAMLYESALVEDDLKHFGAALKDDKPEYVAALDVTCQRVADLGKHAESFGFPTFLALSDLALMTPAAPAFKCFREARLWREVHPGYRLFDLLEILPKIGHYDGEEDPFEYQARFCRELGWPDPRDVLEHGARLEGDDYRTARRRDAFARKLASPELFGVGRLSEDPDALRELFEAFEPHTCRWEGETLVATNELDRNSFREFAERLGYSYLFDLGGRIMESKKPLSERVDWIEAFDERFELGEEGPLRDFFDQVYIKGAEFQLSS